MSTPNLFNEAAAVAALNHLEANVAARSGNPAAGAAVSPAEKLTYFHSLVLPGTPLREMARTLVRSQIAVDWTTVAIGAALFARFDAKTPVTAHMAHRLLVVCVIVGSKAHQDRMPSNGLVGRTVGMKGRELTRLEFTLAAALDWHFIVEVQDPEWAALVAAATVVAKSSCDSPYLAVSNDSVRSRSLGASPSSGNASLIASSVPTQSLPESLTVSSSAPHRSVEHIAT